MWCLRPRAARGWSAPGWAQLATWTALVSVVLGPWARAPAEHDAVGPRGSSHDIFAASAPALPEQAVHPEPDATIDREPSAPAVGLCSQRHQILEAHGNAFIRHTTVPRESLAQIAHRYDVAPGQLREWNDLAADLESVRKGTKLRVKPKRISPPRERIEYVVQPGDTWWRVAVSHGVDSMDLRSYNWPYRGKMTPGETLQIWIDPLTYDWVQATPGSPLAPQGVRRGGVGVGSPNDGMLLNGVKLPEAPGTRLRFPQSAHGTTHAVEQFLAAMAMFAREGEVTTRIEVGSMSRPRGGPLGTHQSHQTGRDLDVRLPRRSDVPSWGALKPSRIDWALGWRLVQALAATDVEVIFLDYRMQRRMYKAAQALGATPDELSQLLQYPRGSHARRGLVRHADGHDKHLHVRFRCGPCEVECV
jgi:LysM repeat protein